ncbi:bifunctional diguanylate cyclase/phosphodiesterase (plasmid) [Nitratireductor sp. GISD-1A_MAKvit]|uniref:EAL domain-containing protein n=1 Tax=Nitratireductor sp. GISD-1A_MAKvit TaxID=3234198 RepID=UPI003466C2E1
MPNRALLTRTISAELKEHADGSAALFLINLDGLARANDYYGAAFTDRLIVAVSERLSSCARSSDILGYLSNGVFCIFMAEPGGLDLSIHATGMLERIKEPFIIDGVETFTSASIGIARYAQDGAGFDELLVSADQAVRAARSESRGRVAFKPAMPLLSGTDKMSIEQRLRTALRDQKLCCVYQPKVDIHTGGVVGVETLLRWRDDDGQHRILGDFVALATQAGIIDAVSEHVANEVMESLPLIDTAFSPDASISFNITAQQSVNPVFMRKLLELLTSYRRPERFIIEITEEAFLDGDLFSANILPMLRETGVRISIDDFGVGYSSLSALAAIAADELKIDRSFVQNVDQRPRSQSVLKAIESLGNALGMRLVIEGVETKAEVDYIRNHTGIRIAQGYYFARPLALVEPAVPTATAPVNRHIRPTRVHAPTRFSNTR